MDNTNDIISSVPKLLDMSTNDTLKSMTSGFNTPQFKSALESLKNIDFPKPILDLDDYSFQLNETNSIIEKMDESIRRKEQIKRDFYNNTQIIAESNVALANSNEQILKTNNQLLNYNEILVKQNQSLLNQLTGIDDNLNNLSDKILVNSNVQELLGVEHIDKLDEIVNLLKNPADKKLMSNISHSFKDIPPQLLVALVVEGVKISLGIGV